MGLIVLNTTIIPSKEFFGAVSVPKNQFYDLPRVLKQMFQNL